MKPTDRIGELERHARQTVDGRVIEPTYRLSVVRGQNIGEHILVEGACSVGSSSDATLQLDDGAVSRMHVKLVPQSDGVRVSDLGSTNGTFVGDLKVESAFLDKTARIRVGHTELELLFEQSPLPQTSSKSFGQLAGQSEVMQRLFGMLGRIAPTDARVLLLGETGVGKEMVAEAIHQNSSRRAAPLVVVDCGSVSAELIESDLFGHVKGAFTGADRQRDGAFVEADGGTLFLDEVGELPLAVQPRLLRAIESGRVKAVGSDTFRQVDVRVISATHRNLEQAINAQTFRADLYYRLAVIALTLPALRERRDDIVMLIEHFCHLAGKQLSDLAPGFLADCEMREWPGNVRELKNAVERQLFQVSQVPASIAPELGSFKEAKAEVVDRFTREYLQRLLKEHHGNVSEVAKRSGLARPYLHELLNKLGLKS
jgi:DNA-binding NtrC family response regulator